MTIKEYFEKKKMEKKSSKKKEFPDTPVGNYFRKKAEREGWGNNNNN